MLIQWDNTIFTFILPYGSSRYGQSLTDETTDRLLPIVGMRVTGLCKPWQCGRPWSLQMLDQSLSLDTNMWRKDPVGNCPAMEKIYCQYADYMYVQRHRGFNEDHIFNMLLRLKSGGVLNTQGTT
jgi:hypothetical protein